ncbi:MAG: hypothetical protein AAF846_09545 [Chloroflexota bacterium]
MSNITYEAWIKHVFDHPVPVVDEATEKAHYAKMQELGLKIANGEVSYEEVADQMQSPSWVAWYFDIDAPYLQPEPNTLVAYLKRAFTEIDTIAQSYSDAQMNQGINYVINNACSDFIFCLVDDSVPLSQRLKAVEAMANVYEKLYAVKCSNQPLPDYSPDANPLDHTCYMWWDIIPFYGKSGNVSYEQLDQSILQVMQRTLQLDNYLCQRGALHGLGHWKHAYPEQVEAIIDAFLERDNLHEATIQYAKVARTGYIL